MNHKNTELFSKLLQAYFNHEIVRINLDNLITFKSGIKSPIYLNNRRLLEHHGDYRNAFYNLESIVEQIYNNTTHRPNYIAGVPTAGLPWAALIANRLTYPFVLVEKGIMYKYHDLLPEKLLKFARQERFYTVVSAQNTATPFGICLANHLCIPFAYVRVEEKNHGIKKLVEGGGINKPGEKIILISNKDQYNHAIKALGTEKMVREEDIVWCDLDLSKYIEPCEHPDGQDFLVIEDHFTTGGSVFDVVETIRWNHGEVNNIISLSTYGFREFDEKTKELGLQHHSAVNYEDIIKFGVRNNIIKAEDEDVLLKWHIDPYGWLAHI